MLEASSVQMAILGMGSDIEGFHHAPDSWK